MTQKVRYLEMGATIGSEGRIVEEDRLLYAQNWDGHQWVMASSELALELYKHSLHHLLCGEGLLTAYYDHRRRTIKKILSSDATRDVVRHEIGHDRRLVDTPIRHEKYIVIDPYAAETDAWSIPIRYSSEQ